MNVCMHVCMHAQVYMCVYAWMYVCIIQVIHLTVILIWWLGEFSVNHQTKMDSIMFYEDTVKVSLAILGQSAKLFIINLPLLSNCHT